MIKWGSNSPLLALAQPSCTDAARYAEGNMLSVTLMRCLPEEPRQSVCAAWRTARSSSARSMSCTFDSHQLISQRACPRLWQCVSMFCGPLRNHHMLPAAASWLAAGREPVCSHGCASWGMSSSSPRMLSTLSGMAQGLRLQGAACAGGREGPLQSGAPGPAAAPWPDSCRSMRARPLWLHKTWLLDPAELS